MSLTPENRALVKEHLGWEEDAIWSNGLYPVAVEALLNAARSQGEQAAGEEIRQLEDAGFRNAAHANELAAELDVAGEEIARLRARLEQCNTQLSRSCDAHEAAEAQLAALQKQQDGLVEALKAGCYLMSEPHLSGHRLVIGFERLEDVQAAHDAVARPVKP